MAEYRTYSRKTESSPEAVHAVKQEVQLEIGVPLPRPLPTGPQNVKMESKLELFKEEPLRMAKYRTYSRKTKRSPEAVHSVKQEFEAVTDLPLPTGPQHVKMKPKHELVKEEPLRKEKNPAYLYSTESSLDAAHAVKQEIDVGPTVLQPTYLPSVLKEPKHETSNEETSHTESSLDAVRAFKQEIDVGPTVLQPTYLPSVLMEPKHETSDEETSQMEEEPACSHNTESSPDAARAIKQDVDPTLLQPKYLPWIEPKLETSNEETAQMEENPACSYYTKSSLDAARAVKQELDVGPTVLQPTDLPSMMMEPKLETTNEETSQLSAERIRNNLALHRKRLRAQSTEPQTECKAKKTKKELHSGMLPGLTVDGKNSKSSFLSSERTPLSLGTPAELLDTLSPPLERPKASRTYSRVKSKAPSSSVADPSRLDVPEAITSSDSSQLNRNSGADGGTMKIESEKGQGLISPITCDRFTTPTERSPTSPNNFEVVGGSESSSLAPSHATRTTESSSIPYYAGSLKTCALLMTPGGSPIIKSGIEEVGESGTDLEGGLDAASDVDITEHQSAVESIDLGMDCPITLQQARLATDSPAVLPENIDPRLTAFLDRMDAANDNVLQSLVSPDCLSFDWHSDRSRFQGVREQFTGIPGSTFPLSDIENPVDAFLKIWDQDIMDLIVGETNRYAEQRLAKGISRQSRLKRWCPTNRSQLYVFFAILIHQSLAPLTVESDYHYPPCDITAMPNFKKYISRNRLMLLKKFLHFTNNTDIPDSLSLEERRLRKVQPVLDHLNHKFQTLYLPGRNIAIDESLLTWHSHLTFIQKIATKEAKTGIKSYELCESETGYLWKFLIYAGKGATTDRQIAPTDTQTAPTNTQTAPTDTHPNDSQTAPTNTQTAPTDTQTVPTDTKTAPTDTQTAPTNTQTAPTDTQTVPNDTQTVPADTQTAPTNTQTAPTDTQTAPTDTQTFPTNDTQTVPDQIDRQTNETTSEAQEDHPVGATANIIYDMANPLFHMGYTLIMDNVYNSPLLARCLKKKGTDCYGTLRLSRENVPEMMKSLSKTGLRTGDVVSSTSGDLNVMVWKDSNLVSMISTYHNMETGVTEKCGRWQYKPQMVLDYNNCMGGVDKKDQLLANFPIERRRNLIWYKKLFRRLLNVSVLNAYIIYRCKDKIISHRNFRLQVAEGLLKLFWVDTSVPPQISSVILTSRLMPCSRRRDSRPILVNNHFSIKIEDGIGRGKTLRRKCVWCVLNSKNSRTSRICNVCNVPLCVGCMLPYHTVEHI